MSFINIEASVLAVCPNSASPPIQMGLCKPPNIRGCGRGARVRNGAMAAHLSIPIPGQAPSGGEEEGRREGLVEVLMASINHLYP